MPVTPETFNVEHVKFCPGPCAHKTPEPEPTVVNSETWHIFKPHSGGRYCYFYYPTSDGGGVVLENVRMCLTCYHRYQDMHDALQDDQQEASAMSDTDAANIVTKLDDTRPKA